MINPELRAQIRRYFYAEHWRIGTIAAELGVHPDAVRNAIESERFRSAPPIRASLADPYMGFVRQTLEQHPRLRATRIHAMLRGRGYPSWRSRCRAINAAIDELIAGRQRTLPGWGSAETEPVMHGENDYERELFNGSLGRIRPSFRSTRKRAPSTPLECDFDGVVHRFDEVSLNRLEIAHAITVHKAQGSQFQRVIIPVLPRLLLDRTLVYTAPTRAVDQVMFIGDRNALSNAIVTAPRSQMRQVGFRF